MYETLNELDSALESYTKSANLIAQCKKESCLTSLISASVILLQLNRIEDAKKALSNALAISLNKEIDLKQGSIKNKKNDMAYLAFLSRLIPEIPHVKTTSVPQILHLGESHCLTFTNQTIEIKGEQCTITPSLVKGAKAFHLNEESRTNPYRKGFENRLRQNLDKYKHIFLSFGEIDCRDDEGIILHCKKTGKPIQDVAKSTAIRYFKWTATSLAKYKGKIVYFGIPAPYRIIKLRRIFEKQYAKAATITIFNATLAINCQG